MMEGAGGSDLLNGRWDQTLTEAEEKWSWSFQVTYPMEGKERVRSKDGWRFRGDWREGPICVGRRECRREKEIGKTGESLQAAPILEVFKTCRKMGNLRSLGEFRWMVNWGGWEKKKDNTTKG